ncbi:hypothetical protein BLA29_014293 [Euroglyphus maynei]|uniref:Uncharacterized protein n=1 Tax=Euroglyphus maynei TaxID=6958 RepID=A0A1Y3B6Y9_EURMA|nr:hypothetical protein BLA29_014293 [Euroglyphus maynei]
MRKARSPTPCIRLQIPDNDGKTMLNTSTITMARVGKSSENLCSSNIDKQPIKLPVKSKSFVLSSSGNQPRNQTKAKRGPSDVGYKSKSSIAMNKLREIEKHLHGTISPPEYYLELDKV